MTISLRAGRIRLGMPLVSRRRFHALVFINNIKQQGPGSRAIEKQQMVVVTAAEQGATSTSW